VSGELKATRRALRDAVKVRGVQAWSTRPERFTPPGAFVMASEPYVTVEDANYGCERVHYDIVLVAAPGINDKRADELDDMIQSAIAAVDDLAWNLKPAPQPGQITLNGQPHVGAVVECDTEIRLEAS
jgi:hypothetical protein